MQLPVTKTALLAAVLLLTGCGDLFLEPAAESTAAIGVSFAFAPAGQGEDGPGAAGEADPEGSAASAADPAAAFDKVDVVWVRLFRGGTAVVDMTAAFAPEGAQTTLQVEVQLEADQETLELELLLSGQGQSLFQAERRPVTLTRGETTPAEVTLHAVPGGVAVTDGPVLLEALGQEFPLSGQVTFATGDPIPGLQVGWSTPHTDVVHLSPDGVVTAVGEGEAQVTATYQEFSATVMVEVRQAVASVTVEPGHVELAVDQTAQLRASLRDANGNPIPAGARTLEWSSSDPDVATVAAEGDDAARVQGVAEGEATITAQANGASGSAGVEVTAEPSGTVSGRVVDGVTGDPIPDAVVRFGEEFAVATGGDGQFSISLPEGIYDAQVTASGYHPAEVTDIPVTANETTDLGTVELGPESGFEGVWQFRLQELIDEPIDETDEDAIAFYMAIQPTSFQIAVLFDFDDFDPCFILGDRYDLVGFEDGYWVYHGTGESAGDEVRLRFTLESPDHLILDGIDQDGEATFNLDATDLTVSDFTPECDFGETGAAPTAGAWPPLS